MSKREKVKIHKTVYRTAVTVRRAFDHCSARTGGSKLPLPNANLWYERTMTVIGDHPEYGSILYEQNTHTFLRDSSNAMKQAEENELKRWQSDISAGHYHDLMDRGEGDKPFEDELVMAPKKLIPIIPRDGEAEYADEDVGNGEYRANEHANDDDEEEELYELLGEEVIDSRTLPDLLQLLFRI